MFPLKIFIRGSDAHDVGMMDFLHDRVQYPSIQIDAHPVKFRHL